MQQDEHIQKVILHILKEPDDLGRRVGFKDLTSLHREWIREMIDGEGDYTLQAHRGSYKSSCLAVAIAILMILKPKQNIIFLRKTDSDVAEMLGMTDPNINPIARVQAIGLILDRGLGKPEKFLSKKVPLKSVQNGRRLGGC